MVRRLTRTVAWCGSALRNSPIGGRSTIVPTATQEELRKTISGVQIVTMPGLWHYPSPEQPDAFEHIVKEFLRQAR